MIFFGRGVLLEYHVPVFELRSQRNSNPRNAKLPPGRYRDQTGLLCVERHADGLRSWRMRISARSATAAPSGVGREHDHVSRYRA